MSDRTLVSIGQACVAAGVSRRTVYNWLATGKVQYLRTAGGAVRIYRDTLFRRPDRTALPADATRDAATSN